MQIAEKNFDNVKVEGNVWNYYLGNELHRLDGPAIEHKTNPEIYSYYVNGELHRSDGPAHSDMNGKSWYQDGVFHREGGPACEYVNGDEHWYQNGKLHRIGGPATIRPGIHNIWYKNGKFHRLDGPAIETPSGKDNEWHIEGVQYTEKEFNKKISETSKKYKVTLDGVVYYTNAFTLEVNNVQVDPQVLCLSQQ